MIKLKEILAQNVPEYLYHATFKQLLPSIREYGLNPDRIDVRTWNYSESGRIYLANDPDVANDYTKNSNSLTIPNEWFREIITFRIKSSDLDSSKLHTDNNTSYKSDSDIKTYEYHGIIPWTLMEFYK